MAKKVRRVRKTAVTAAGETPATVEKLDVVEKFEQEYAYVLKDLQHVLLLAFIMFVLLIGANIFLQ